MRSEDHSLKQLQEDECWKLFDKHAFRDDDTQPDPEYRKIGMEIVKKCKGLPLALKKWEVYYTTDHLFQNGKLCSKAKYGIFK